MQNKQIQWLIYTVCVGLIPVLSRLLVYSLSNTQNINIVTASDFIIFGLVLHISNINELEHIDDCEENWKTIHIGTSILFIVFYSILYCITIFSEAAPQLINAVAFKYCSIFLAFVSFALSFAIYSKASYATDTGATA